MPVIQVPNELVLVHRNERGRLASLTAFLTQALPIVALAFAGLTAYVSYAGLSDQRAQEVESRYEAAVNDLGSSTMEQRWVGVFELKRLMDAGKVDQPQVIGVLVAFVRRSLPAAQPLTYIPPASLQQSARRLTRTPQDVQSAFDVINSRARSKDPTNYQADFSGLDLRGVALTTDMSADNFSGADFSGQTLSDLAGSQSADFSSADFKFTIIKYTTLRQVTSADFSGATLEGDDLDGAQATGAVFWGTKLNDDQVRHANLACAVLTSNAEPDGKLAASFTDTDLTGSDLSDAAIGSGSDTVTLSGTGADVSHARRDNGNPGGGCGGGGH